MNQNLQFSKILMDMKNVIDFYNKLSAEAAEKSGITKPEADILIFLNNNPSFDTAKDISKLKGFSKAYVSKAVEPLFKKGLITIEVDSADRRCQHIKITEKATPIVAILHEMQVDFIDKITDGIDPEAIKTHWRVAELFSQNALKF